MKSIQKIRESAFQLTDQIIKELGPRLAGNEASRKSAQMIESSLSDFCDQSSLEDFNIHQGAFFGWIQILVSFYIIGIVLLWFSQPIIALVLALSSILILVLQFFFYLPIIDFLYPKKRCQNAVGIIEPKNEVKKQVVISGHHDSARIFNFFIHQPNLYNLRVTGSIAFVVTLLVVSILQLFITNELFVNISNYLISLGGLLIIQMWFFASKRGTPGAGDNLISSAMAVEIGRHYVEHRLEHTRIIIASFDAEEEGLRGSRAFAKKHEQLLNEYPTVLLNADCMYELDEMFFLTTDINGTQKLSESLAKELTEIAKDKGFQATYKPMAFLTGGTDAGELSKKGVNATTLIAMPWTNDSRSSVYHTPNDTLDHVEEKLIDASIDIFTTYIEKND